MPQRLGRKVVPNLECLAHPNPHIWWRKRIT
jgi:hypothetical protein